MIGEQREGGLCTLTLKRPDKANALTRAMLVELADRVEEASGDTSLSALILTGAGRVFSAGADLDEARAGLSTDPVWERLSGLIAAVPFLTIAALNGSAAGGALGMVLACDMRVAVRGARIFYPVMALGFLPQPSDPARMRALIGPSRTKLLLLGGAKITTDEAYAFGLVDRLADDALAEALALAGPGQTAGGDHVRAMKRMV